MSNNDMQVASQRKESEVAEDMRAALRKLSTVQPLSSGAVARHAAPLGKVSVANDMTLGKAAKVVQEAAEAEEELQNYHRKFMYRPNDGAYATKQVLEEVFGTTGRGVTKESFFFGVQRPDHLEINISLNETVPVPFGEVHFAPLEGTMYIGGTNDPEYGQLFYLSITCPRKFGPEASGLFNLIELYLQENSIYKGKAVRGTDDPQFIPTDTDPSIVYNAEVYSALESYVWGPIRQTQLLRDMRIKTDPKILLHGPFGTGKSEAGRLTAKIAVENGWTFIQFDSGKKSIKDLEAALQTARLLSPAVVYVEDIDIYTSEQDDRAQTRLLEMFDGLSSKGNEVMVVMTSNRKEAFSKGMLRAGRISKMIEIKELDREATERLFRVVCGDTLGEVDFDKVFEATAGFEPAFIRQVVDDARQAAAIRTNSSQFTLNTEDFITAAHVMRPQHDAHRDAKTEERPSIETALVDIIREAATTTLTKGIVIDDDYDRSKLEIREKAALDA